MINPEIFRKFPVISTKRFLLIRPEISFAEDLFEIYGDPASMLYMERMPAKTVQECKELINSWNDNFRNKISIRWAVVNRDEPRTLIGTAALHNWHPKNRRIELGADINRKLWGRGIASEITAPIINFAFENFDINRCELRCNPKNTGSVAIAEKFAMKLEGILREYVYVEGKGFSDEAVYVILRKYYRKF